MFLAMNRFSVPVENAESFEAIWLDRNTYLRDVAGFVEFNMLRGPETNGHVLYASHAVWASEDAFITWTRSEQFRLAHRNAGHTAKLYAGNPAFEGFTSIQTISRQEA